MSSKYVPSFLKGQQQPMSQQSSNIWSNQKSTPPSSFPMNRDQQLVNTSLPAKEAPKLVPGTLASLTSNGTVTAKGSFASKFANKAKIIEDPDYVPPPKQIDLNSEEDFPSLGGSKPTPKPVSESKPVSASSFADLARNWAKKKEEDEEAERVRIAEEDRLRRETQMLSKGFNIMRLKQKSAYGYDNEEDDGSYNDDDAFSHDSFEVPSQDESESDEENQEEDEFNGNLERDRRHRNDLY
jgi:hypothetical protein